MPKKRIIVFLLFICSSIILAQGFYQNRWNLVPTAEYTQWRGGWESLVVGRLVKSNQDGIFSAGALLGIGDITVQLDFGKKNIIHQYEIYKSGGEFKTFLEYKSFPGFQGIIFSVFDKITKFHPNTNIKIFRVSVALTSAMVLALFAIGLYFEFGWGAYILAILFIVFSKWFILPGGNLYWNLWSFYLAPVLITFLLERNARTRDYPVSKVHWILFTTTVIKILFSGFEFITTQLIMTTVPFVYFAKRDNWGSRVFLRRVIWVCLILFIAVIVGLCVLMFQISAVEGGASGAIAYILKTLNHRMAGSPENFTGIYAESMKANTLIVIWNYFNIPAMSIGFSNVKWTVTFLHLFTLFFVCTGIFIFSYEKHLSFDSMQKGKALAIAVWYSILAPLSWLVLFKPHSYIHTFLNPIIWQMPFTILGLTLLGFVLSTFINQSRMKYKVY